MTMDQFVANLTGPTRAKLVGMNAKRRTLVFEALSTGETAELHRVAQAHGISDHVSRFAEVTVGPFEDCWPVFKKEGR